MLINEKELAETRQAANTEKFMNVVRKHTALEGLTPTLLREFVEKIVVHEATAADGRMHGNLRRQEIFVVLLQWSEKRNIWKGCFRQNHHKILARQRLSQ